jgi:hypothetical protein
MDRLHWRAAHDTERVARRLAGRSCDETLLEEVVDKAAIFAEVTKRNALRRANFLPPTDVRAEFARQVALARQQEYHARCNEHADEREVIRLEVLAELRAKYGANFGGSTGGRWAIGHLTWKRFEAFMEANSGVRRPVTPRVLHSIACLRTVLS